MKLSERQMQILRAIIEEYRDSVTPVGSRVLARRPDLGFSAATIRNEMADLEAMGYLEKPHTSAGRLPTKSAYRLYVEAVLEEDAVLSEEEQQALTDGFSRISAEVSEVCAAAVEIIASITGCIGVALSPLFGQVPLRRIQIVRIGISRQVALIITEAGLMLKESLNADEAITDAELERISDAVTGIVAGRRMQDAALMIHSMMDNNGNRRYRSVIHELIAAINRNRDSVETFLGGRERMWNYPEYRDWRSARCLESLLNTQERLVRLLGNGGDSGVGFTVSIGPEAAGTDLPDLGVVTGGYTAGSTGAVFGVIGPARMDYSRVLPILRSVGRRMSNALCNMGGMRDEKGNMMEG